MQTVRIIPCLDVKDGRVVKGVNFVNLVDAGDPVEAGRAYCEQGADEIVFLDIAASNEKRKTRIEMVRKLSENLTIPFIVGGGVSDISTVKEILDAGADKIGINTAAVRNPDMIKECSELFGKETIIVAVDAKKRAEGSGYDVYINGGSVNTGIDVIKWSEMMYEYGAGEILLTSIDYDGTKMGYDVTLTKMVKDSVGIPVICSGGAGKKEHFLEVIKSAGADAVLAASLFHFKEIGISELKEYLKENGINVMQK